MDGLLAWSSKSIFDSRGEFRKIFDVSIQSSLQTEFELKDAFVTSSSEGVLRGMHLQKGRAENFRLIHLIAGKVIDVQIDLREHSSTWGEINSLELKAGEKDCIFLPPGVAHGFQALEFSIMHYSTTSNYDPDNDTGINPLTIPFQWPQTITAISERDMKLPTFQDWMNRYVK